VGLGGGVILHPPILPSFRPAWGVYLVYLAGQVVLVPTDERLGKRRREMSRSIDHWGMEM